MIALPLALLAASIPLIALLRTYESDRLTHRRTLATVMGATATRVVYSVLVVAAYAILPLAWALGAMPTGALAAFFTAPLAIRLGDIVSHRRGPELTQAVREAVALLAAFAALYWLGTLALPG